MATKIYNFLSDTEVFSWFSAFCETVFFTPMNEYLGADVITDNVAFFENTLFEACFGASIVFIIGYTFIKWFASALT